jgi:hypothetical protein
MKSRIIGLIIILLATATPAYAGGLFVEGGTGFNYSKDADAVFLRYQKETSLLFGMQSFYEASYGHWSGVNHNNAVALARGIRLPWAEEKNYVSGEAGLGHVDRTTNNLGTHYQILFRVALGHKIGVFDFSLGYVHYSNGKYFFGWHGPNYSENFVTAQAGLNF